MTDEHTELDPTDAIGEDPRPEPGDGPTDLEREAAGPLVLSLVRLDAALQVEGHSLIALLTTAARNAFGVRVSPSDVA